MYRICDHDHCRRAKRQNIRSYLSNKKKSPSPHKNQNVYHLPQQLQPVQSVRNNTLHIFKYRHNLWILLIRLALITVFWNWESVLKTTLSCLDGVFYQLFIFVRVWLRDQEIRQLIDHHEVDSFGSQCTFCVQPLGLDRRQKK